jgi:hypothetical protein
MESLSELVLQEDEVGCFEIIYLYSTEAKSFIPFLAYVDNPWCTQVSVFDGSFSHKLLQKTFRESQTIPPKIKK